MDYNNMNYNSESREPINYKMPSKGLYTFLMIVGRLRGALGRAVHRAAGEDEKRNQGGRQLHRLG